MVIFSFPTSWFSRHGENKNPTTSGKATSGRICFLPQVLNHKWRMKILPRVTNDKLVILPIPTSPQMRINIPILQVKMKYFDLFYSTDQKKIFSKSDE